MCGIFAICGSAPGLDSRVHINAGKHRGPEMTTVTTVDNILFAFHRLAINGYGVPTSNQPLSSGGCHLICNGEIYNWKQLSRSLDLPCASSDCDIILQLYRKVGIQHTVSILEGVFAFVLYDSNTNMVYVARDTFGVRPLFRCVVDTSIVVASELKMIVNIPNVRCIEQFSPGTVCSIDCNGQQINETVFTHQYPVTIHSSHSDYLDRIRVAFVSAVQKRTLSTDRPIACLLSGGLDSSLVCAIVSKLVAPTKIHTWSIGMPGSPDLKYAQLVANHIGSIHHQIETTADVFLEAIPDVIKCIESYDVTTVRASIGNWLIAKQIRENSDSKVIFNGDGADELCGGYIYMKHAPDPIEFDHECRRLLKHIHFFDGLRSDRTISAHGLEARTPFLDLEFVHAYLSIPSHARMSKTVEKGLLREAFSGQHVLPDEILHRPKEAFSDGVSDIKNSWLEALNTYAIHKGYRDEAHMYISVFNAHYPECLHVIPYAWMPKYVQATDPSARTLHCYVQSE